MEHNQEHTYNYELMSVEIESLISLFPIHALHQWLRICHLAYLLWSYCMDITFDFGVKEEPTSCDVYIFHLVLLVVGLLKHYTESVNTLRCQCNFNLLHNMAKLIPLLQVTPLQYSIHGCIELFGVVSDKKYFIVYTNHLATMHLLWFCIKILNYIC